MGTAKLVVIDLTDTDAQDYPQAIVDLLHTAGPDGPPVKLVAVDLTDVESQDCPQATLDLLQAVGLPAGPTVTFDVYCDTCGAPLCNQAYFCVTEERHIPSIRVKVCERCLEAARKQGAEDNTE